MAKLTVKDLAQKYGVSTQEIIRELSGQGIDLDKGDKSVIPEDMAELVDAYLDDLYNAEDTRMVNNKRGNSGNGKKGAPKRGNENQKGADRNNNFRKGGAKESGNAQGVAAGSEITLQSPIVVKNLAEALGRKPNEIITDLIKLGELAGINQAISEDLARKVCEKYEVTLVIGAAEAKTAQRPVKVEEEEVDDSFAVKTMLMLAIATSIDALAVGVTLRLQGANILLAAPLIALTTGVLSPVGLKVGNVFGVRYKSKAELAGGVVLVGLGVKFLLEGLGVL